MENKKGQATNVFTLVIYVIVLVVAGIAAAIGLSVLNNQLPDFCSSGGYYWNATAGQCELNDSAGGAIEASTLETNATIDSQIGISNITSQFGNIGLVAAAVVIIGLLVGGFYFLFRMRGGGV